MGRITNIVSGAYQQARIKSMMVAEANKAMKSYPKDHLKEALSSDEGIKNLASEIYLKLSEVVRNSISLEKFESVIVATRQGFMKNKKNKKILGTK